MEIKKKSVRIKSFFRCCHSDDDNDCVALAPEHIDVHLFPEKGYIENFPQFFLKLENGTRAPDYLSTDIGGKLCSKKLMDILEKLKGPNDEIQWIKVPVYDLKGKKINYYFLHFPKKYDVLDKSKTKYSPSGRPIVPALSLPLLEGHSIFSYNGSGDRSLVVYENVKAEILKQKCTGIKMSRAKIF